MLPRPLHQRTDQHLEEKQRKSGFPMVSPKIQQLAFESIWAYLDMWETKDSTTSIWAYLDGFYKPFIHGDDLGMVGWCRWPWDSRLRPGGGLPGPWPTWRITTWDDRVVGDISWGYSWWYLKLLTTAGDISWDKITEYVVIDVFFFCGVNPI